MHIFSNGRIPMQMHVKLNPALVGKPCLKNIPNAVDARVLSESPLKFICIKPKWIFKKKIRCLICGCQWHKKYAYVLLSCQAKHFCSKCSICRVLECIVYSKMYARILVWVLQNILLGVWRCQSNLENLWKNRICRYVYKKYIHICG